MSSPLGANHTIINGWVSDASSSRGTFSIISSCVLTLSLCVYTAVHLNVQSPEQRGSRYRDWFYTAKWVGLGVFAPELLCFVAWRQWISARSISQTIKKVKSNNHNENDPRQLNLARNVTKDNPEMQWSSVHSHYTNMGGFVVDFDDEEYLLHNPPFTAKTNRLTLTPRGVRLLIECGHMPSISKEDILDKSKTDTVAQLLSLLQTAWFAVQMIARHMAGLQITLLELNTIAHVICAIFVYILWWRKPKSINQPTRLSGPWLAPILAYMFMNSRVSGWKARKPGILKKTWVEPEFSILALQSSKSIPQTIKMQNTDQFHSKLSVVHTGLAEHKHDTQLPSVSVTLQPLEDIMSVVADKEKAEHSLQDELGSVAAYRSERWSLAAQAIEAYEPVKHRLYSKGSQNHPRATNDNNDTDHSSALLFSECQEYVTRRMPNWTDDSLLRDGVSGVAIGAVLWSLSIFYGGLHAIAWYDYFASSAEQYLWRLSCVWIAGSGCLWVCINLAAHLNRTFLNFWETVERLEANRIIIVILGGLAAVCGLGYVLARAFLVFEAFISLRSMPQDAFDTPAWIQIIPHL